MIEFEYEKRIGFTPSAQYIMKYSKIFVGYLNEEFDASDAFWEYIADELADWGDINHDMMDETVPIFLELIREGCAYNIRYELFHTDDTNGSIDWIKFTIVFLNPREEMFFKLKYL